MGNDFGLSNPFYKDKRFAIYQGSSSDEHQMLVDGEYYVSLVRGILSSIGRGNSGVIDYVMEQLRDVDVSKDEVVQVLLRGRIAELEKSIGDIIEENFENAQHL